MRLTPLASTISRAARTAGARPASATGEAPALWDIGLPAVSLRPERTPASVTRATAANQAHLNGRNLQYGAPSGTWGVNIAYLSADMLDLTPQDPLNIWGIGSYKLDVGAARIDMDQRNLNTAIAETLQAKPGPVKAAEVSLLDGNRVAVKGRAAWKFIPLPFSVRAHLAATSPTTVALEVESAKVFGLPVLWAVKLFGIDIASKLPAMPGNPVSGRGASLSVDLNKVDMVKTRISAIDIRNGQATLKLGTAPEAPLSQMRTLGNPNYCEVITQGEVSLEAGVIRNGKVVILDNTPETPYALNRWDKEGYARIEYGQVVLPEEQLKARFGDVGEGFHIDKVSLSGTDLVVKGEKEVLGMPIPVSFKVRFSATPSGELKLTPHSVHVAGLGFGQSQIVGAMAKMKGMRKSGDGVILDLKAASSVEMPAIKRVTAEAGRIVLGT